MECLLDAVEHLEARRRQTQTVLDDYTIVLDGLRRILAVEAPADQQPKRRHVATRRRGKHPGGPGPSPSKVTVARREAVLRHLQDGPLPVKTLIERIRPTRGLQGRHHKQAIYLAVYALKRSNQIRRNGKNLELVPAA